MNPERIEAAAKLRYDRIHGEGSYDQLSVGEMVDLCDEIEASVSAWLEAGPTVYEVDSSSSMIAVGVSEGWLVGVKSDDSRCPANHWEPGLGPCICKGRVHKGVKSDDCTHSLTVENDDPNIPFGFICVECGGGVKPDES